MSTINFGSTVSLDQAAKLILATPENRYLLQGEPGIGKSSLLKTLSKAKPEHEVAYVDVPNMDLGDIAMPVIDRETKTTAYYPNSRFKVHTGKPVITMLDEYTKGADPVKNMLHPMLEVSNPRLGDISLHPESITFLTGNLSTDGVGDQLKAHSRNRVIPLTVRKPSADEWIGWALNNDIDPMMIAFAQQFPQIFDSYLDEHAKDNPYIYNPKKVQTAFISPRSMERASNIVRVRHSLDSDSVICALSGALGEAGSRDLQAFVEYADQLPAWESITKNPTTADIPSSAGACAIVVFGAIAKLTKETLAPFMTYLERFEPEWQACFAINIAKTPSKQAIAFSSKSFTEWVAKNEDLL
jgi:energy-coupling factor transporter ATP-binding protein EcfA2